MAPQDEHEFQWNIKEEGPLLPRKEAAPEVRAGEYLVEIESDLKQLQEAYLSGEQRTQLGAHLRTTFLYFQRLTPKFGDKELRTSIAHYLGLVGALSVTGDSAEPLSFLEALATNEVSRWADGSYERGFDPEALAAEHSARRALMQRLETE